MPGLRRGPEDAEHLLLNCASCTAHRLTYLGLKLEGSLTDNNAVLAFLCKTGHLWWGGQTPAWAPEGPERSLQAKKKKKWP